MRRHDKATQLRPVNLCSKSTRRAVIEERSQRWNIYRRSCPNDTYRQGHMQLYYYRDTHTHTNTHTHTHTHTHTDAHSGLAKKVLAGHCVANNSRLYAVHTAQQLTYSWINNCVLISHIKLISFAIYVYTAEACPHYSATLQDRISAISTEQKARNRRQMSGK